MTIEFDDKGKFYTDRIKKEGIEAIIQTDTHKITGLVHIRPTQRIKDELDLEERFLAVTDASVFSPSGELLYQCQFIAIQRSRIIWVIPSNEI